MMSCLKASLLLSFLAVCPGSISAVTMGELVPRHPKFVSDESLALGWWIKLPIHEAAGCPRPNLVQYGRHIPSDWGNAIETCELFTIWTRPSCLGGQVVADENYACTEPTAVSVASRRLKESGDPLGPASSKHPIIFSSGNKYLSEVDEVGGFSFRRAYNSLNRDDGFGELAYGTNSHFYGYQENANRA